MKPESKRKQVQARDRTREIRITDELCPWCKERGSIIKIEQLRIVEHCRHCERIIYDSLS